MAYLRPLNSSEANLFVIRFTSPLVTTTILTALSGSHTGYYVVNTSSYTIPTSDLLPSGFRFLLGDSTRKDYKIEFGTMNNPFTEPPTVTITLNKKNITTDANINKYKVMLKDVTISSITFEVIDNDTNLEITPFTGGTVKSPIFNVMILGSVMSGATFAISNRGWNVPESSVNKLYTYQSVGIGTGKVDGTFNLKGTTVTPAYFADYTENNETELTTIATNIVANTLTLLTIPINLDEDKKISLPAGKNGQIIRICITNNNFDGSYKFYINGNCLSTNVDYVLVQESEINKMTELYYDEGITKWRVINYSSITPSA